MSKFKNRYVDKNRTTYVFSAKELLEMFNELGASIDIEQSVVQIAFKIRLTSGEELKLGAARSYKKLLNTFNEMHDMKIDVNRCFRKGTTFTVAFFEEPSFKSAQQEEKQPEQEIDNGTTSKQEAEPEIIRTGAEEDSAGREEENEEPPTELIGEEVDENAPNWKSLSTPTFGKKKLAKLAADEYGIELDQKMKYQEMVEDFKYKYNNREA